MNFDFLLPAKPVSGIALPIFTTGRPQPKQDLFKKSFTLFFHIAILLIFLLAARPAAAQLDLNFGTNFTQKVGSTPVLNSKYLYTNVATGYDCIVTITDIQGSASLFEFDDNSLANAGAIARFQPIITAPNIANNTSYVRFKFQLITSGSYNNSTNSGNNAVPAEPIWFRSYDVDGNGAAGGVSEFVELNNSFTGSWVDTPTSLITKTPITPGGNAYIINSPTINGAAISDDGIYAFNGFIYANTVSSWDIIGGSVVGTAPPDPSGGFNDADRLRSWSFKKEEVVPGIDFGDAPSSYSGATPIIPAYHLVPSVAGNIKLYIGNNIPDADYDPSGNAAANVDDNNRATNDEDGLPYIYFPKYSGSGAYTTTITATNTSGATAYMYGYIDFNGDGDFADANEKSVQIIVPSTASATLQTFTASFTPGFTYTPTSVTRYARFRIATSATEAGNANGAAVNGEVEDYRFNNTVLIKGKVWLDANGLTNGDIDGVGIGNPGGVQLYAILVDSNNKVLESVAITTSGATTGEYTLTKAGQNNNFKVILSTIAGIASNTPPTAILPDGWVNTGEGTATAGDGLPDGSFNLAIANVTTDITGLDFGIEPLPLVTSKTITPIGNPGGFTNYTVPANSFLATDAHTSGSVVTIAITGFPVNANSITIGSTVYTNGGTCPPATSCTPWPASGVSNIPFNAGNPTIKVDPIDGNVLVPINFTATDNAGFKSKDTATLNLDFKAITVTGIVWKDINGNAIREAATEGVYTSGGLKAVLVDANDKVIQTVDVSNTGSYTITDLPYNVSNYKVIISTATGAAISAGALLITYSLPNNYVVTGENKNGTSEPAGDGTLILPSTGTALTGYNFGMEQLPETVNKTITFPYVTPGYGNSLSAVPLQGSDPDDSQMPTGAGGKFIITQLPLVGQAILTYNDVDITTAGFIINNYNPSLLGVRHTSLTTSTFFKYATIDAAGKQDLTPATYTINLASLLPLNGINLSANQQGNTIKLNWEVTGERNVVRYELEYSINNTNFTSLASVSYRTSANGANTYTYTHLPAVANSTLFYRVIQYHADGSTSISNQVSVRLNDKNNPSIAVMPTLITDLANLRIHTATPGKTIINVVDNNGRLVMKKEFSLPAGSSTFSVDGWAPLANGTYYIQVNNADLKTVVKVIVQH